MPSNPEAKGCRLVPTFVPTRILATFRSFSLEVFSFDKPPISSPPLHLQNPISPVLTFESRDASAILKPAPVNQLPIRNCFPFFGCMLCEILASL
jgi:hypothetical protein